MRDDLYSRAGWHLTVVLVLFAPLVQGGSPRLPTMVVECAILLLAALWMYEWGWRAPSQAQKLTLADFLLALFLFWALFSFLFAPYQHGARRGILLITCYSLLYWWLVFHPSLKGFRLALFATAAQGLFQALVTWYQWLLAAADRPAGTFHNMNFMAGFLAACAVIAAGRVVFPPAGPGRGLPARLAWAAAAVVMAGALVVSGSRGGVLAFCAGMTVLLWLRRPALALAGAAAGLGGLFLVPNPWVSRLTSLASADVYAYSRLSIWKSALRMMVDHPWFGVGLGQFEYFSSRYAFPVEGHWAKYGRVAEKAHNEYLQVGAEMGVLGLVLTVTAVALLLFWSRRAASDAGSRAALVPVLAAMTALLTHAAVDFIFHVPPLALLLVLLAAGARLHGAAGPSWPLEFRFRKGYSFLAFGLIAVLAVASVRPVVGFWYFLAGVGSPRDLLHEKWALEDAAKRELPADEAVRFLRRAVAIDPSNAAYHNALGSRYFRMSVGTGDGEALRRKALYHANYASALNPNNHRYSNNLAEAMESLYALTKDRTYLAEAKAHYGRVLSLTPRSYAIHERLGFLEEAFGNLPEAETRFRAVVELEPNYLRGWYNFGIFLARGGRMTEAERAMRKGAAAAAVKRTATTPYERKLVDFDREMFDNWLREKG